MISFGRHMIFPDRWADGPPDPPDFGECPSCGCTLDGDKRNREVWCPHCEWEDGYDWEAAAEARAEAREERYGF